MNVHGCPATTTTSVDFDHELGTAVLDLCQR